MTARRPRVSWQAMAQKYEENGERQKDFVEKFADVIKFHYYCIEKINQKKYARKQYYRQGEKEG